MLGIFSRRKQTRVTVGARYQNADMSILVWEVASTFNGIDGTPYAHIFCVNDTSRRKTVAQSALESGVQYRRLSQPAETSL
ncbi:MAG: hypothetical protein E6Q98_04970 [Rhodospirillaceae bacterium]|jgi:hypothetical protein|nr:MAG: hypothetical protein E6Q98_04970 [Rhodospirillaceae bacterium]